MFGKANNIELVEALRLAGQRGILTTGEGNLPAGQTSENIFVIDSVPHDWLFPQMAAVVHHGGAGTTGASLRAGKPTIICPFVGDQSFWGRRVADLAAGPSILPLRKLTAQKLANAIKIAIVDETIGKRAASLGQMIRAEDGVGQAVAAIKRQL